MWNRSSRRVRLPRRRPSITELLLAGKPVRLLPSKQRASKPVEVWISDLYEKDGRLLIRYAVRNHGSEPYAVDTPEVYQLDGVRSPQSLYGLTNSQLGDEQAAKLKAKQQTPVKVLDGQMQPARIAPGEEAVGVVTLQMASSTQPTILRFQFPSPKQSGDELERWPAAADRRVSRALNTRAKLRNTMAEPLTVKHGLRRAAAICAQAPRYRRGQSPT